MGINTWTKVDEKKIGSNLVITEEFIPTGQPTEKVSMKERSI